MTMTHSDKNLTHERLTYQENEQRKCYNNYENICRYKEQQKQTDRDIRVFAHTTMCYKDAIEFIRLATRKAE